MSLIAELKRRSVFKVAAAYLVVGWLAIQVAATVAPQLDFPDWVPRLITFVLLLGFPVTLVLAWVFERTPEGVRVDARGAGGKLMFGVAALLVAATVVWYWRGMSSSGSGASDARTIAVLPFVNMSGDAANEYFSDGISEEILNVLAGTPELQVAARTSSFAFKGQPKEIPEIARELNVRMVLEGSVRRQDDRVRITAQLVDAEKGFHVWLQSYNRQLKDIFAIQDEIAHAIGSELKVKIASPGGQAGVAQGTESLVAYDLYLRGLALWQHRGEDALWQAAELFERAAAADPGFAQAYAGQALVYAILGEYSLRVSIDESDARARDFAERALALDHTLPEPYAAMGYVANTEMRRATAQALLRQAIALRPSFATAHQWLGESLLSDGDFELGLTSLEKATALDPRSRPLREPGVDEAAARRLAGDISSVEFAALRGDADLFFSAYEDPNQPNARDTLFLNLNYPYARTLASDMRAKRLLRELGFEAYWREKGWPALCRPLGADDFECGPAVKKD